MSSLRSLVAFLAPCCETSDWRHSRPTRVTRATFQPLVLGRANISGIGSGFEPVIRETVINTTTAMRSQTNWTNGPHTMTRVNQSGSIKSGKPFFARSVRLVVSTIRWPGVVLNRKARTSVASSTTISIMANPMPMHMRGPAPKGR